VGNVILTVLSKAMGDLIMN